MRIAVSTRVEAPIERVWAAWTTPEDIVQWNFASPEWCCPRAELALSPGGTFSYRMEAKDGSAGFDFEGTFVEVDPMKTITFKLSDDRVVTVSFSGRDDDAVVVEETFEAEDELSAERQRQGWQAILETFRTYVESRS